MYRQLLAVCVGTVGFVVAPGACADFIYQGDRLTDTATGLVWTRSELPTSTFIPTTAGTVATWDQLFALANSAGLGTAAAPPLLVEFATWMGWGGYFYAAEQYSEGVLCSGPNNGGNCFAGMGFVYGYDEHGDLTLQLIPTLSLYGPTFSSPFSGWETDFVSTLLVAPVPLPAGVWLFLSAFAVVTRLRASSMSTISPESR